MMLCYFALGLAADYSVGLIRLLRPYKAPEGSTKHLRTR